MWRIALIAFGAFGAFVATKPAWRKLQQKVCRNDDGQASAPMQIIAKGALCFRDHIGPFSVRDLTLRLVAMAKVAEKQPPSPPGKPAQELSHNAEFLALAQYWRAMAEAVYVCDRASFSLQTHLPESALVHAEWNPDQNSLRPAYALCVDAPHGAVVLSIRGTSHVLDMLLDCGASSDPFCGGQAHGGYAHATEVLLEEIEPHMKVAFSEAKGKNTKLVLVGHSMGAAIAIMCGLKLREKYPGLECWGYSTPACLSHDLSVECAKFTTTIVSALDVIPRFSITAVERLRQQVMDYDWEKAKQVLKGDPEWENIEKGLKTMNMVQEKVGQGVDGVKDQVGIEEENKEEDNKQDDDEQSGKQKKKKKKPAMLYPPGRLLVLSADPPGFGKKPENRSNVPQQRNFGAYPSFEDSLNTKWVLHEAKQEEFTDMVVSPWSISDHMLGNLCEGIGFLQRNCP